MRLTIRTSSRFAAVLSLTLLCSACGAAPASLGTFKVNGKDATLHYATLFAMNPISGGMPRMRLVLSEDEPPKGADPDSATFAGALGTSLDLIVLKYDGKTWSNRSNCDFVHPGAKDGRGSSDINVCGLKDVVVKNGEFHARFVSGKPFMPITDTVALDLEVNAKMP
jgi:hypothetical protein